MLKVLKFIQSQLVRMRKKQHFSQSLPRGELRAIRHFALPHTVTEICTTSFVNFVIRLRWWYTVTCLMIFIAVANVLAIT